MNQDDARWQAVCDRDRAQAGAFLYAVRSTGIYCAPGCGSRRPKRENVSFYAAAAEARAAGYRPCKRCEPDRPSPERRRAARIGALCEQLQQSPEPLSLDDMARLSGWSASHLHRSFKAVTGLTPFEYQAALRDERLREDLPRAATAADAIAAAGYASSSSVTARARERLGMTAGQARRGGAGLTIRVAFASTELGELLVAGTEQGVCALFLGDDRAALRADLEARFARAELVDAGEALASWVEAAVAKVTSPASDAPLPLDVQGTAFQRKVWEGLRAIPAGETRSYAELAAEIGEPGSARAVAGACARNPVAVAVPCHRVLRKSGQLSGYRWGKHRKAELLRREGVELGAGS